MMCTRCTGWRYVPIIIIIIIIVCNKTQREEYQQAVFMRSNISRLITDGQHIIMVVPNAPNCNFVLIIYSRLIPADDERSVSRRDLITYVLLRSIRICAMSWFVKSNRPGVVSLYILYVYILHIRYIVFTLGPVVML